MPERDAALEPQRLVGARLGPRPPGGDLVCRSSGARPHRASCQILCALPTSCRYAAVTADRAAPSGRSGAITDSRAAAWSRVSSLCRSSRTQSRWAPLGESGGYGSSVPVTGSAVRSIEGLPGTGPRAAGSKPVTGSYPPSAALTSRTSPGWAAGLRGHPGPPAEHLVQPPHRDVPRQGAHLAQRDPAAEIGTRSPGLGGWRAGRRFRRPGRPGELSIQIFRIPDIWRYIDICAAQVGRGVEQGGEVAPAQHRDLGLGDGYVAAQQVLAGDRATVEPGQLRARRVDIRLLVRLRPGREDPPQLGVRAQGRYGCTGPPAALARATAPPR